MKNIYTDFFEGIVNLFKIIGNGLLIIFVLLFQFGIFIFTTVVSLWIIQWILGLVGINLGISL
jgi:hypothetical protein